MFGAAFVACVFVMVVCAAGAVAAPSLRVVTLIPDYVTPGKGINVSFWVQNTGDVALSGNLTVKYTFPAGVAVSDPQEERIGISSPTCSSTGQVDECEIDATGVPPGGEVLFQTWPTVDPGASGSLQGSIEVSGGGTPDDVTVPWRMSTEPIGPFDFKAFDVAATEGAGAALTQAGADPVEQSTNVEFPSQAVSNLGLQSPSFLVSAPVESFKDVVVHVPAGFVGNPAATPVRCDPSQLTTPVPGTQIAQCPLESQIGVVAVNGGELVPLYNVKPPIGSPAEFGFFFQSIVVMLDAKLRPSDDGIDIVTKDTPTSIAIPAFKATLWGVPGDSSHNPLRGTCLQGLLGNNRGISGSDGNCPLETARTAFLRMPTSCSGNPLPWNIEVNTYQHPETWLHDETTTPAVTGCQSDPFAPTFSFTPSTLAPNAPSGADVTLSLPQEGGPDGLAEADLRTSVVTLPRGLTLNPSTANGLQACSDAQLRLGLEGPSTCPDASKIGSLTLHTPLIDHPLGGSILLRTQNSSDPASGEMFRIALEIRSDEDGIDIKLPGAVKVDPARGQITATFDDNPQLPFASLHLHFNEGPRGQFVTPQTCGSYATHSVLTGWNGKTVEGDSSFAVSGDGNGAPCPAPGFAPGFKAGTVTPVAGAFSPFALRVTRSDADQQISSISEVTMPPGLTGEIASIPVRCTDAQAAAAACPAASRVGNVTVGAGAGPDPFYVTDGAAYLTGPYKGAPFGLAFVVHAQAGPFDLGMVVVRAAIEIDPHTAQVKILSDPLPTMLDGVPLRMRDIRVSVDRPGFMLNPTNCSPLQIGASVASTEGASANVSSRFQVGECEKLAFKPKFSVTATGHPTRKLGAGLTVRIGYPKGAEANLSGVRVRLPRQLPSRLTTLQQACPGRVFDVNPAACPVAARVGIATVATPLLASKLSGPAYFVSHGVAKFPDLAFVLQGEGVTVVLTGETFIDEKTNITTTTFRGLPDVPVATFALSLPQGPHSALAGHLSLCGKHLSMATILAAQNGATIHQATQVAVSGCKAARRRKR